MDYSNSQDFAPIYPDQDMELMDESGQTRRLPRGGAGAQLPAGAQTFGTDTQGGDVPAGDTTPPAASTPPPPASDTGAGHDARHGGTKDPATGQQTVGQPTGPAPTTTDPNDPYGKLEDMLSQLLSQQLKDRDASARGRASLSSTLDSVISNAQRPISATDPEIAGPTGAFYAQGQRARRLMQENLAQQAASTGRTTGSVDQAVNQSFEDLGNATGSYQGNLMTGELENRRSQLMGALAMATQFGTAEDAARIQEELGLINSKLQMQGQKNQIGSNANSLDEMLALLMSQQAA